MNTSQLDRVIGDLCKQAGLGEPDSRHPIRVWRLSGVERLTLVGGHTVILKYAGEPFTGEAEILRACADRAVPVPRVLADVLTGGLLVMLLEDLGEAARPPSDVDAAQAAAGLHTADADPVGLAVWGQEQLVRIPDSAMAMLTSLRDNGRYATADDLLPPLEQLAGNATTLAEGAEIPPFGLVHGELHPTSLHIGVEGLRLLDFGKAFRGPGLLDLATWQGTRRPPDPGRLQTQIHAYVAAGGPASALHPRGGLPAPVWAAGWHRLWSAAWFLRQATTVTDGDDDRGVEAILRRQVTTAGVLLQQASH